MLRISVLLFSSMALMAAEPGIRAELEGGTAPDFSAKATIRLDMSDSEILILHNGKAELRLPYQKVNTLEYGQSVSRRYAAAVLISPVLLLSKSHKHFVTLGFTDRDGQQQSVVIRVEKGDIRTVLTGLEARTGRRVEYQDNEARKAGKG
jgi:hypothetical protein